MKNNIFYTIIAVFLFLSGTVSAQERNIMLVHGLVSEGSGMDAWIHYDNYFNASREANPIRYQYTQQNGLSGAATDLRNQMAASVSPSTFSQNIAIAHSQGGLVLRTIAKNYPESQRPFGGFITVGTPNLGAQVINSYKSGKFTAFTSDALECLLAGPSPTWLDNLVPPFILGYVNSKLGRIVEDVLVEKSAINNPTTNDFYVGAPFLNDLSTYNANIPKVGIIAQESTPNSHWKVLSSYTSQSVTELPFNSADDTKLEGQMKKAYNCYKFFYEYNNFRASIAILPHSWNKYTEKAKNWQKGMSWFTNSEGKYRDLIGALSLQTVQVPTQACIWPCTSIDCSNGNMGCNWQNQFSYTSTEIIPVPYDGIVPMSAQVLPGSIKNFELPPGVNHAQERNHPFVTTAFDNLMNGSPNEQANIREQLKFFAVPQ